MKSDAPRYTRIFVYGTLRAGAANAALLRDCAFVRAAVITGTLYDFVEYPALVLGGRGVVHGEVWTCPGETLPTIDAYEGVREGLFTRVKVQIGGDWCWTYVAGPALVEKLGTATRLESGRW